MKIRSVLYVVLLVIGLLVFLGGTWFTFRDLEANGRCMEAGYEGGYLTFGLETVCVVEDGTEIVR